MNDFNQESFNEFVLKNCEISFLDRDKELVSGRKTRFYFNWRLNDTFLVDKLSGYIINFVRDRGLEPNCFYGIPEGATGLAIITQLNWARQCTGYKVGSHPLPLGRKIPKSRDGQISYFVNQPRGKTIVLEDTITLGTNLFPELDKIGRLKDTVIIGVISLTDRMQKDDKGLSIKDKLDNKKIPYFFMSNSLELLPLAYQIQRPTDETARRIEEEYKKYGVDKLNLIK